MPRNLRHLWARVVGLFRRETILNDIEEEFTTHVELETEANINRGMSPDEARKAAQRTFGNPGRLADRAFDVRGGGMLDSVWQDIRYGGRYLYRHPGFAAITILSLALGIGANTAIFSLLNAVLLKPLPFPEADRIMLVWEDHSDLGFPRDDAAPGDYADWKKGQSTFDDLGMLTWRNFNLTGAGEPEKLQSFGVSSNFFSVLGVQPILGRGFFAEEDRPGSDGVIILSYAFWQRRFGGASDILGRKIMLDGEPHVVIGVMPKDFQFLQNIISVWVPAALTSEQMASHGNHYLTVVGRLKPGVTRAQAQTDIANICDQIARTDPENAEGLKPVIYPLRDEYVGESRQSLYVLLAAVGVVLLIACANTANLLMARSSRRRREIAMRFALGARKSRVLRQLLTESLLIAFLGAATGLMIAYWSFGFLKQLIPPAMTSTTELRMDPRVLGFTFVVSILTGCLFGLLPALQASKINLNEALKQSGERGSVAGNRGLLRKCLVVVEISLALVLLVSAGLLVQTIIKLTGQYSFLRAEQLLTVRTGLTEARYNDHDQRASFYRQVLDRVSHLPGVVSAGYTTSVPLQWKGGANGLAIEGTQPPKGVTPNAIHRQVSSNYLQTIGDPLLEGRYLDDHDVRTSQPVIVINQSMARQLWPNESAIGKRVSFNLSDLEDPWRTIVGVVADIRQMRMDGPAKAEMYIPFEQITTHVFFAPRDLAIRTTGDPRALIPSVRREIAAVDPDQPISSVATMTELLDEETAARRMGMRLVAIFALLALLLAAMGVYGTLSNSVSQRTAEIGLRMALGAKPSQVLGSVVASGLKLALLGLVLGLGASLIATRVISSLLFGVSAADPATYVAVSAMLMFVAFCASYFPARRAMKMDPLIALRSE